MMGRLRSLLTFGSTLVLVTGLAIATVSLSNISVSNAAFSAKNLLPALAPIDTPTTDVRMGVVKPKLGALIGTLTIPRLNRSIPIYEGTEKEQLRKGAGHYRKSVLPGLDDNSVLAGHRDSVFTKFAKLKRGDLLLVNTYYGEYTYQIDSFRIVKADDRTVIVPTPVATLTLSTCYPFYFIGSAPDRFIVSALLVPKR